MDSPRRSIIKTISWRLWATLITATLAWSLTGSLEFAATIGLFDTTVKLLAYYLHERFWARVPIGLATEADSRAIRAEGTEAS